MKFQIEVSEKKNTVKLKPRVNIIDASYWQKRIKKLLPANINIVVAK